MENTKKTNESLAAITIADFLARLGSGEATPGGGGAAALAGACSAALVTMVARLTSGKAAYAAIEPRLQEVIARGDQLRAELMAAIDEDAEAFDTVMAAYGLPKKTPAEKQARQLALQPALKKATESPLHIARACSEAGRLAIEMAQAGNPQAVTDAGIAATLTEAAIAGAILQARVNLKALKDAEYVAEKNREIENLLAQSKQNRQIALEAVELKL